MRRLLRLCVAILFAFSVSPLRAEESGLKLPPYKKVQLDNGMTLLLMEQHEVPLVSFHFIVKAGSTADPAGKAGLASLTAALLRKGTKTRSADQISAELDFIGGQLDAGASADYTSGEAEFVKKDLAKGLDLLADTLLNPTFPENEVTKMVAQRIDGIRAAKDRAQGVIGNYFNAYLYGSHPYGRPSGGDENSLAAIKRGDVANFYQTYYTPGNTIVAAVGDFALSEMEGLLADKFKTWPARPALQVSLAAAPPAQGKKLLLVDKPDSTQTFYQVGNVGIARTHADRSYVEVVNTLFGDRFTSMLNSELRVNTGLTYGAGSFFDERVAPGPFVISTYTRNATTEKAIDMTLEILKRLHERKLTEDELKSAKNYVKGQFPPTIETTDRLAGLLAEMEFYGLDRSEVDDFCRRIDAMTAADAHRVIDKHFPLDDLVFVLIGKASEIQDVARKYAPKIDIKSISQPGF